MDLVSAKKVLMESINPKMFDDPEFYDYLLRCFDKIDSAHNEIDEIQVMILLTISNSIATTFASIRNGECEEDLNEEEIASAAKEEKIIIEFIQYLSNYGQQASDADDSQGHKGAQ